MPKIVVYVRAQQWRDFTSLTGKDEENVRECVRIYVERNIELAKGGSENGKTTTTTA